MYVPGIKKKLIFVSTITDQNLKVEFFKTHCIVKDLLDHCKPMLLQESELEACTSLMSPAKVIKH
jgi:hypothetical protein